MKTALVFREGCSGRFVRAVIEECDEQVDYRMPDSTTKKKIFVTHTVDFDFHRQHYDLVLRILPTKKIYNAIYNNFSKKLLLEQRADLDINNWMATSTFWYDLCFDNIKEYFALHTNDIQTNQYTNIIDFDQLSDQDYFEHLLLTYFDLTMTNRRRDIIRQYVQLQLPLDLCDDPAISMHDIADAIPDHCFAQSPWFFSYCVFKFEHNNGLTESQRSWSVNQLAGKQTKSDLLRLSDRYT